MLIFTAMANIGILFRLIVNVLEALLTRKIALCTLDEFKERIYLTSFEKHSVFGFLVHYLMK